MSSSSSRSAHELKRKRKRAASPPLVLETTDSDAATVRSEHEAASAILSAMWEATLTHDTRLVIREAGCEDVHLSAHRAVLAAASRPFRSMLSGGGGYACPCSRLPGATDVELREVSAVSMRSLLRFIYGQDVEITSDNALPLYRVADMYEVLELTAACCAFLKKRTTVANACEVLTAADAVHASPIVLNCLDVVKRRFEQAAATASFRELPHALLRELLQENELAAKSEEVLLEALLAWYDHEPEARRPHLATLAAELRWPFISAATIARLEAERPSLFASPQLVQLCFEAYRHQALEASRDGQQLLSRLPQASPRSVRRRLCHCDYESLAVRLSVGDKGSREGEFNCPEGLAVDRDGRVIVADSLNHRVQIYRADGTFVRTFGANGSAVGSFNMPGGIAVGAVGPPADGNDRNNNEQLIIVTDQGNGRVQVFDSEGTFLRTVGTLGSQDGQLLEPTGVAINAAGQIVVADYQNHRVQIFADDGTFVLKFGEHGAAEGQFEHPSGIAIGPNGDIVVADYQNDRIQVFTADGTFVRAIGTHGAGPGEFDRPFDVAVSSDGHIIVTDYENHRCQVLSETGEFVAAIGSHGSGPGQFDSPGGVTVGPDGRLFVTDCGNGRYQVFSS